MIFEADPAPQLLHDVVVNKTLSLLISCIYGAHCKAKNFNVVYICTYVRQHWKPSLFICCTKFQHWINAESFPVSQLCVNTLPATKITLITNGIYFGSLRVKHRHNCTLKNVNICISVSAKIDEQKHSGRKQSWVVMARRCDRWPTVRGCSDGLATSEANHPVAQCEITEKEGLNNTASKASKLASSWNLRNPKKWQIVFTLIGVYTVLSILLTLVFFLNNRTREVCRPTS
jgi:hypothetical protein